MDRQLLLELAPDLTPLLERLQAWEAPLIEAEITDAATEAALAEFEEIVMSLDAFAGVLMLPALGDMLEWVSGNVAIALLEDPATRREGASNGLFSAWLSALQQVMASAGDELAILTFSEELSRSTWPEAIRPELLDDLISALSASEQDRGQPASESAPPTQGPAIPTDSGMRWDPDINPRLLDAFFQEAPEQTAELAGVLQRIANQGARAETLEEAHRLAHTIKGSANLVGIQTMAALAHRLEDVLLGLRPGSVGAGVDEILVSAADTLETMLEVLRGTGEGLPDLSDLLAALDDMVASGNEPAALPGNELSASPAARPLAESATESRRAPVAEPAPEPVPGPAPGPTPKLRPADTTPTLRVPVPLVDNLLRLVGEMTTTVGQLEGRLRGAMHNMVELDDQERLVRDRHIALQDLIEQQVLPNNPVHAGFAPLFEDEQEFDPLELDQYHAVHGASNAFVEAMSDARALMRNTGGELHALRDLLHFQERLGREFTQVVLSARMVPATELVPRMQRAVRETARQTDKNVRLDITGEHLPIDTEVADAIAAPLMHMLRNAVDHGIEAAAKRSADDKPAQGVVRVEFVHEGNELIIRVEDDGSGIDPYRLRARALESGWLDETSELSDGDLLRLVLLPGFSTRDQVSDISGRGVGMDVVQTAIDRLHGSIDIDSEPGRGTRFVLRLPRTLVAVPVLLIRNNRRTVAIPAAAIDQLIYATEDSLQRVGQDRWFARAGERWPLHELGPFLGPDYMRAPDEHSAIDGQPVLLARTDTGVVALAIDEVVENREVVVKELSPWLPTVAGISGACILPDGSVAPVLDLRRLLRNPKHHLDTAQLRARAEARRAADQRSNILIVDDSLTARLALEEALAPHGVRVYSAIDGLSAVATIERDPIDMVITDLEMPGMNGLELLAHLRGREDTRELPVVMVTSRSADKHRYEAEAQHVDAYLVKPFDPEQLWDTVQSLIREPAHV